MFGLPADATWLWLGLVIGTAAMFGVVTGLPAAPPEATQVAATVDEVAASDHPSAASVEIRADAITIGPNRLGVRGPGGTAWEPLRYGPVTPVREGSRLAAVLHGAPPASEFAMPASFEYSIGNARNRDPTWRPVNGSIQVRRVRYGEVNSVLVGT